MIVSRHKRTFDSIFTDPVTANLSWRDVEAMLVNLGAEISEGSGSRSRVALNGRRAVFHRPHPEKEADRGSVRSVRRFLISAGITTCH